MDNNKQSVPVNRFVSGKLIGNKYVIVIYPYHSSFGRTYRIQNLRTTVREARWHRSTQIYRKLYTIQVIQNATSYDRPK